MIGLVLVVLVLVAVGVLRGLLVLVEFAENRRAARFAHCMGRSCGRVACAGCWAVETPSSSPALLAVVPGVHQLALFEP